ncbi:unnamed protein product, partial [Heterosigma akashiwo]
RHLLQHTREQNARAYRATKNRAFLERGALLEDEDNEQKERHRRYLDKVRE